MEVEATQGDDVLMSNIENGNINLSRVDEINTFPLVNSSCNFEKSVANSEEMPLSKIILDKIQAVPGVKTELDKIEEFRMRMLPILISVKFEITNNVNICISLDEDFERIKTRTLEFATRFKRNYFYRTKCQLHELRMMDTNPFTIRKKSQVRLVIQKLSSVHQSSIQALQVIEKQLQTTTVTGLLIELLLSFYNSLLEITFILKPFLGQVKMEPLDDNEIVASETIKTLRRLMYDELKKILVKERTTPASLHCSSKLKKTKNTFTGRKLLLYGENIAQNLTQNKEKGHHSNMEETEMQKPSTEESKDVFFMMLMKQRPGAKLRHAKLKFEDEPTTMVEILEKPESDELTTEGNMHINDCKITSSLEEAKDSFGVVMRQKENGLKDEKNSVELLEVNLPEDRMVCAENESFNYSVSGKDSLNWVNLKDFRNYLKLHRQSESTYNRKSFQTLSKMTEKLMDEALYESVNKIVININPKDLSALKKMI